MRLTSRLAAVALCAFALLAVCALPAPGQVSPALCGPVSAADRVDYPGQNLLAETDHTGVVDLLFEPSIGVPVTFYECLRGRVQTLGTVPPGDEVTGLSGAVPWLCGRPRRDFRSV